MSTAILKLHVPVELAPPPPLPGEAFTRRQATRI